MSVATGDIVLFGSAGMPEDDTTTPVGGAIDTSVMVVFDVAADPGVIRCRSSSAADTTQNIIVTGVNSVGSVVSEQMNLNGTTNIVGTINWKAIWKIVKSAVTTGDIIIETSPGGVEKARLEKVYGNATGGSEIMTLRRVLYAADSESGAEFNLEKVFFKNTHSTDSLANCVVTEVADTIGAGIIDFALAASVNDTDNNGAGNRTVDNTGLTYNSSAKNVPGGNLTAGSRIGVWFKMSMGAGEAADIGNEDIKLTGATV